MSLQQNYNSRTLRLIEYLGLLIAKQAGKAEFHLYEGDLRSTNPFEVNEALDAVLSASDDVESLAEPVARFIRAVSKALDAYPEPLYPKGHLLAELESENAALERFSARMQQLSLQVRKEEGSSRQNLAALKDLVASTDLLGSHYVRLQNELFPLFEKTQAHHSCVKLMWALQDRTLALKKEVLADHALLALFWKVFGQFFFLVQTLLYRERQILFPVAYQSMVEAEERSVPSMIDKKELAKHLFVSPTGSLDFVVLEQIFKLLPLDVAFIDSEDRVAFYSDPPHRIFPRSPHVIGRLVQNCHPPKSVGTVEKILTSFREGGEDCAEFYLSVGGRFVHIEYFAVRSADGSYLGTLEVTQDASHLRALEGEKRLL
ncbi:MAG: PAS domain-containing protein [Sphaerochaeta sp.]|nr:PAS domain-containing protein [Sphaerochaeta sp.]